jgi:hypothetical protein
MTTTNNAETVQHTTKEWCDMGHEKANEILSPMPVIERLEALQNAPTSMVPYKYWIQKSKAELMQWYMNAYTTCSCIGRSKAERNEDAVKYYSELMEKYGVPKPASEICYILGVFNGEGSK